MGKGDKRIARFRRIPKDFRFDELVAVFGGLGFDMIRGGGSHVTFIADNGDAFTTFDPHGRKENVLPTRHVRVAVAYLTDKGYI